MAYRVELVEEDPEVVLVDQLDDLEDVLHHSLLASEGSVEQPDLELRVHRTVLIPDIRLDEVLLDGLGHLGQCALVLDNFLHVFKTVSPVAQLFVSELDRRVQEDRLKLSGSRGLPRPLHSNK